MLTYPTLVSDPINVVLLAQEFSALSFLSIASGEKHTVISLHSLHFIQENDDASCMGIIGARNRGTAVNINVSQLFKISTTSVPSIEAVIECELSGEDPTEIRTSTDIKICNLIPIPPQFAALVLKNTPNNAGIILKRILEACVKTDLERFREKGLEKDPQLSDMPITAAHLPLFQHLYPSKIKSPRKLGYSISDNEYTNNWVCSLDAQLQDPPTSSEENNDNTTERTTDREENPQVSWDSENTLQTQEGVTNNRSNGRNHFTFTGSPSSQYQRSESAQTRTQNSNQNGATDQHTRTFISAMENMTNNHSRFTHSMEQLVNATASKFNDDGTKKIGKIIKEVVCNASTTDGQNPSPDLTSLAKDILSLPGDQPLILLNILFHKNKTRARATPKFISAMRKGNLTYESANPDGLSIAQLPQFLAGTELRELDISRLLNMEENGTITEIDTLNLNKFRRGLVRVPGSRQLTATWIDKNFNELQEIKAACDKDLPAKVEIAK